VSQDPVLFGFTYMYVKWAFTRSNPKLCRMTECCVLRPNFVSHDPVLYCTTQF
jgi:hypothetical protein